MGRLRKPVVVVSSGGGVRSDARRSEDVPARGEPDPRRERRRRRARRFTITVVVTTFVLGATHATLGRRGYVDLLRLRRECAALESELEARESRVELLRRRIEVLDRDPTAKERLVREHLGRARPGEWTFLLPRADADDALAERAQRKR